ncbi:Phosphonate ABC transporter phosphate-binding periplasmic component [Caenispirillum salinarum AK4]|uniref:Phosphonate ABC transporter phosphate-binding periplasmic component n=1 Tax=Caenispirillum salinarum AK4 TaxID=1238182 RepID=K9H069_9PROT|nr:phosphonate ABC transporter substrate-binding protein [Caenispirillum salinarum]EKV30942.1 Phosphonate ABC transporter phosphate-binding periplasmic component [Caenispirillum salinarum AK4]
MQFRSLVAVAAAATVSLSALTAQAAEKPEELNFGIISTESTQNLKTIWEPFLADMEEQTGMEVKPFFATDYAGIIEAMRFGKVDIAWYGNKSAMEAVDRANGSIFAQTVDVEGNPGYWSLLVTHKDSALESVDDVLKCDGSLNFGYGDPNSTSGFLVPSYYVFAQNGVDPKDCFKTVRNANHETNLVAAANKQVDVSTNNTENLRRMQKTHPDMAKDVKVIWKSPLIPSDPIVWRNDLADPAKAEVIKFFMTYGRIGAQAELDEELKVLSDLGWAPFQPSSNAQLIPIRQLELFKNRAKIAGNENLSEQEKKDQIAEIDAQLDALKDLAAKQPKSAS